MRLPSFRRRRARRRSRGWLQSTLPVSLRWRLTAWVAGVMLVSAAVFFLVVYQDTGTQLESEIDRDISGDTAQLIQSLQPLKGRSPAVISAAAKRYVVARPDPATSTVLFVLIPGVATASNHPEFFGGGQPEAGETETDQQVEKAEGGRLKVPRTGYSP